MSLFILIGLFIFIAFSSYKVGRRVEINSATRRHHRDSGYEILTRLISYLDGFISGGGGNSKEILIFRNQLFELSRHYHITSIRNLLMELQDMEEESHKVYRKLEQEVYNKIKGDLSSIAGKLELYKKSPL